MLGGLLGIPGFRAQGLRLFGGLGFGALGLGGFLEALDIQG